MRSTLAAAILTATTLATLPSDAEAQFRFRGVEFWGGQYAWVGAAPDAGDFEAGFRGSFAAWAEFSPSLGIGLEGITGGFDSTGGAPGRSIRWDDTGVNLVLRQALGDRAGLHPFVEGRFGWTRIGTTLDTEGVFVLEEDGLAYGGEVGVEVPLNARARLVVAGGYTRRDYGTAEGFNNVGIQGGSIDAGRWGFRLGVAIGRATR